MRYDRSIIRRINHAADEYIRYPTEENAEKVIAESLQYASSLMRKLLGRVLSPDDMQEVRLGIFQALRSYDPAKGKFSSWMFYRVKKRLYGSSSRDIISMSGKVRELVMSINRLERSLGREPTLTEIRKATGATVAQIGHAQRIRRTSLVDMEDLTEVGTEEDLLPVLTRAYIDTSLSDVEKEILELIYCDGISQEDVAMIYGMSPQSLRAILEKIMDTLKEGLECTTE